MCVYIGGNNIWEGDLCQRGPWTQNIEQVVYLAFFCVSFQSTAPLHPSPLLSSHPYLSSPIISLTHPPLSTLDVSLQLDLSFLAALWSPSSASTES